VNPRRALLGTALGVAGLAGAVYGLERSALARIRARPDPDAGADFALPPGALHRFPSHDGGTIATRTVGTGPPIVLSHGVTLSNRTWVKQFESLAAAGFQVVAFDHRGHGESETGDTGHSLDNLAADVRTVIDALDLTDAVLVGHSMGGIAVQAYAARHAAHAAAHVNGLVLLSTLAKVRVSELRGVRTALETLVGAGPDFGRLLRHPDLGFLAARVGFGTEPQPSHVELTRQMIGECARDTNRGAPRALFGLDLTPELASITLPTLVVGGTADLLTPPAESRRISQLIPGARLELFPGAGHMLMLERAKELDELIVGFAREVGAHPRRSA